MESILTDSMVFCKISTFKPYPNSTHRFRNTSHRFNESDIKFLLKPPFFGSPLFLSTPKLKLSISSQIAARFQRPKRRNALRKKLIGEEQEQVRNSNVFHQEFPFKNEENFPTSSNYSVNVSSNVIETGSVESDVLNLSSDSVRWNELISWASQYKEDNDCWGVGSGSIFTVYQDRNGNVDRVYVNEDEIIRRSGVEPGFLNQEKQAEKFADANSKILRAKAVAREIEIGSYKVPRNSSIAKFVLIQGKRSIVGNRSLFESVGIQKVLFSKISRVGFVVMCGTMLFWAVKKLFMLKDDSVKLTKVQKKMLQRKIKSRMEKEKMMDSNVEVLPNVPDLTGPIVRPQLNTDELMQIILKAKATDENLSVLDTFSSQLVKNTDFDDKIVEIQEMARAVRKLEQEGPSKFDEDGETISDSEVGDEELDRTDISETKSQVDNIMMDAKVLMEKQKTENHKKKSLDFRNNLLAEKPDKSLDINEVVENNDHQNGPGDYAIKGLKNEHKNINDPNGQDSSIKHNGNLVFKKGTEETENRELSFHDSSSGSSPPESKKAIKTKPRIIRSVKEAREYLSQRHGFGTEKEIRGKKMDKKLNLSVKNIDGFTNEELDGQASQQIFEKNKFEEISESIPRSNSAILMNQSTVRKEQCSFEDSKPLTNSNASSMEKNVINTNSGSLDSVDAVNGNLLSKKGTEETENRELSFHDSSSGCSPPESKKSIKMRPRIVRPVKEARDYLLQNCGFGNKKETQRKKMDKKLNLSVKNIDGFSNEELNGQASQQIFERNKFEETSESIPSSNTAILMNQYTVRKDGYSFEDSKPLTNSNASSMETNVINTNSGSLDSVVAINGNLVSKKDREETENRELSFHDSSSGSSPPESKKSIKMKPRIIRSVKEAGEYLSEKHGFGTDKEIRGKKIDKKLNLSVKNIDGFSNEELNGQASQQIFENNKFEETSASIPRSNTAISMNQSTVRKEGYSFEDSKPLTNSNSSSIEKNVINMKSGSLDSVDAVNGTEAKPLTTKESWVETDFEKFHPIVEKIGVGFRENYMVARERMQEESSLSTERSFPGFKEYDEDELEWMKDDGLREIVFQVRENELAGRDPFHLMDAEDKHKFFEGLEKKVEKENVKLLELHEWVHSRVENLDYGADGISLYDPPEKIIPRWKGPAIDKDPEFLKDYMENRSKIISRKLGISQTLNPAVQNSFQKSKEPSSSDGISTSSPTNLSSLTQRPQLTQHQASTNPKTVIQGSDGSIKAGKKTGKEYWQHTKKWSREFLEMYNAETDPEVKSVMKDMGKDLDKWITDKEIQETADLMTRIPKRKRKSIEKKLDKLKRECEMFGPQAVVSKYREYSDQKEEDYLWWLDLPFVLCIELYTMKDNIEDVGFYSLEMAEDLELDPKQYHVIAFQDTGDSKNFCYIIQAHMEMLGNGSAFVVARPSKEAFREAKANGFNVTVIRKGQLQLNVDQTLEEVESEITEIGNKMYHDKIMREHSIDMGSLMNSVFGRRKSTRRRPKRMLTKSMKKS